MRSKKQVVGAILLAVSAFAGTVSAAGQFEFENLVTPAPGSSHIGWDQVLLNGFRDAYFFDVRNNGETAGTPNLVVSPSYAAYFDIVTGEIQAGDVGQVMITVKGASYGVIDDLQSGTPSIGLGAQTLTARVRSGEAIAFAATQQTGVNAFWNGYTLSSIVVEEGSFAGLASRTTNDNFQTLGSRATILAGKNQNVLPFEIEPGVFVDIPIPANAQMNWRSRVNGIEVLGGGASGTSNSVFSDVVNVTGLEIDISGQLASVFALEVTYGGNSETPFSSLIANDQLVLGWLDEDGNIWKNAVDGNIGVGVNVYTAVQSSWADFAALHSIDDDNIGNFLGSWGIDTSAGTVWAILNHNSQFAAIAVENEGGGSGIPEPASLGLLSLGVAGLLLRRRR